MTGEVVSREFEARDGHAPHRVIGSVEREHSMNGVTCDKPWKVIEFKFTAGFSFRCESCKVTIGVKHPHAEELLERWDGAVNKNPDSRPYPGRSLDHVAVKEDFAERDNVCHVPVECMNTGDELT